MKTKQPKIKSPENYAEFLEAEWSNFKTRTEENSPNVPPANYSFRVGESVRLGFLHDVRVEEILRDGRLIHVSYQDVGETYGVPYDNKRRLPRLVWWVGIEPLDTETPTNFGRERINVSYTSSGMTSLLHTAYWRGFINSPDYQRDYVWTLEDKQRLVRSIMNRMDIGKFVFLSREWPENRLEIIDGKQRINAILEFIQGRFPYEGKTWFQFSLSDKHVFKDLMIQVATLDDKKIKKSDILWLFLSINTGGVPQTEEHVAKAQRMYEESLKSEGK